MISSASAVATDDPVAPSATRVAIAGWRDPRLAIGVVIVTVCVVAGSVLFAHADDTVLVWAVRRDLPAGTTLTAADLEPRQIRIAAGFDAYLDASHAGPVGRTLGRAIGAGELLPAAALASAGAERGTRVPLAVGARDLPATVSVGSTVDVWVTSRTARDTETNRATRVLAGVRVVGAPGGSDPLAPDTTRSVIVLVPGTDDQVLADVIGRTAGGRVLLTEGQSGVVR